MNAPKLNLYEKVKDIVDQYKLAADAHTELHRQADARYLEKSATGEYNPLNLWKKRAEEKEQADRELAEFGAKQKAKMVAVIRSAASEAKKALTVTSGSADYSSRVNLALAFLREEGRDISDEICFDLIGEFKRDLQSMGRFHRIVERMIDDPSRLYAPTSVCYTDAETKRTVEFKPTGFPKTFQYMTHANTVLDAIDDLLELTEFLFTRAKRPGGNSIDLGNHPVTGAKTITWLPMLLSLDELMDETRIQEEAQDIDLMLTAMEEAGDFKDD